MVAELTLARLHEEPSTMTLDIHLVQGPGTCVCEGIMFYKLLRTQSISASRCDATMARASSSNIDTSILADPHTQYTNTVRSLLQPQ